MCGLSLNGRVPISWFWMVPYIVVRSFCMGLFVNRRPILGEVIWANFHISFSNPKQVSCFYTLGSIAAVTYMLGALRP